MIPLVLAVFLAVGQASSPVSPKASRKAVSTESVAKVRSGADREPSGQSPTTVQGQATSGNQNPRHEVGGQNLQNSVRITELPPVSISRDWADWILWGASTVLALVGIVGICVAIKTLRALKIQSVIMRRQTKHIARQALSMRRQTTHLRNSVIAAKTSADAALLNVQAIINSERAWIDGEVVKTERIGVIRHALKVTNHGKTPARIIGYDFQHGVLEEGPDFSSGTLSTHFSEEAYLLLGSGETKTVRDDFDMADIFSSLNVNSMGTFRVTIKYFDIVSEGVERKVRETCLVYLYKPFLSALAPLYERNQYT